MHLLGQTYLGAMDSTYLFAYAIGMFFSGHLAERSDLRLFLTLGMLGSALMCCMFGLGYIFSIHTIWYFGLASVCANDCRYSMTSDDASVACRRSISIDWVC